MGIAERRARERASRRATIMDAAEHVFFAQGIERATMDDVAQKAELSKGLLYFYFKSKDDLAHSIVHRGLAILENMFRQVLTDHERGIDQVRAMGEEYVRFSREYRDYFNLMAWFEAYRSQQADDGSYAEACEEGGDRCIELVARAVQNGVEDGTVRSDLDPFVTAVSLWAQTHGLIGIINFREVQDRHGMDPDALLSGTLDLMTHGLAPRP